MYILRKNIFFLTFSIILIYFSACTTDKQIEGSGTDNTGALQSVRKKLYKRKDTKINLVEHPGHEEHLDTLTIIPEDIDTIVFKSADVSLKLLAKDINIEHFEHHAKFSRVIIKSRFKKYIYRSKSTIKLPKDSYISVAYLCNPKGFSIKTKHSIKVYSFKVIEENQPSIDAEAPMIFINRPIPNEQGGVALDFILVNTSLSEDGYLVKVNIDGKDFYADKWIPFNIHGLKPGKHKIQVSIVNKDNEELDYLFCNDSREFILK